MDTYSNGCLHFIAPIKHTALVALSAVLLACAQPDAGAQASEEDRMQGMPPPQDARTEQDRVAAMLDEIARETGAGTEGPASASEPTPLPAGPALTASALEAGIVHLARELAGAEQTHPEFVGRALGVVLANDGDDKRTGVQGSLDSGRYEIAVWTLYPDAPGRHVSIRVAPPSIQTCALNFGRVEGQLHKAGYESQPAPRSMDPSVGFFKNLGSVTAFVRLDVDSRDTPRCIKHVAVDLESNDA